MSTFSSIDEIEEGDLVVHVDRPDEIVTVTSKSAQRFGVNHGPNSQSPQKWRPAEDSEDSEGREDSGGSAERFGRFVLGVFRKARWTTRRVHLKNFLRLEMM